MKRYLRFVSLLMVCILFATALSPAAFATSTATKKATLLEQHIDDNNSVRCSIEYLDGITFYIYSDNTISYCAQISENGNIQFSYIPVNENYAVISGVYDINEIYSTFSITCGNDVNFKNLNRAIIDNASDFTNVTVRSFDFETSSTADVTDSTGTRGFSTLTAAVTDAFGANYQGSLKAFSLKKYNGTEYRFNCKETQTSTNTTPTTLWVESGDAISTVIAFLASSSWNWVATLSSLVLTGVTTVLQSGVRYVKNGQTIKRCNVSVYRTRGVTVDGYSQTMYRSGWTRKMYFFCGDLGWTHDTGYNYNFKESDFDDAMGLINSGYNYFISYVV